MPLVRVKRPGRTDCLEMERGNAAVLSSPFTSKRRMSKKHPDARMNCTVGNATRMARRLIKQAKKKRTRAHRRKTR